jgi:DNA polymerase III alpha subunit
MSVEQLVQKASAAQADTVVLTDINNSTAIPEFAGECTKHNIRPAVGIEFRSDNDLLYTGIARNNKGTKRIPFKMQFRENRGSLPCPTLLRLICHLPVHKSSRTTDVRQ